MTMTPRYYLKFESFSDSLHDQDQDKKTQGPKLMLRKRSFMTFLQYITELAHAQKAKL
jgi:hypothetical protein